MKKKLITGFALVILLSAFCATNANAQSEDRQSNADETAKVALNGTFTLFWSWSCGTFSKTSFFINSNGTFSDGFSETGTWIKNNNVFTFHFDAGNKSTWSGKIGLTTVDGIASMWLTAGSKGCFQLVKGSVREKNELNGGETRTPSGALIQ